MENVHGREYELKLMLTEDEYHSIDSRFEGEKFIQVNHYFDTPEFNLYKNKVVVRLRQKSSSNEITVKTKNPGVAKAGIIDMHESTIMIDDLEAGMLLDGKISISMYLSAFPEAQFENLSEVGLIRTSRKIIFIDGNLPPAELDKSFYNGIIDYELEWELDEGDYRKAVEVLRDLGISMTDRSSGLSKYGRLVRSLIKRS